MTFTLLVLYNIMRVPLFALFKIAGFFNAKIRKSFKGRQNLFTRLDKELQRIPPGAPRLWVHISSMGELEQGIPLIDELLARFSEAWIVISLFSPSVYEHIKLSHERTIYTYLPFDSLCNAGKFIHKLKPRLHVIIRHDIWPNYQWLLQRKKIPSILVDASFSDKRLKLIKRWRSLYTHVYATFAAICVISQSNKERLASVYPRTKRIIICGDTRYDRVYSRATDTARIDFLRQKEFFIREKCLVAGSTWPADEKVILPGILKAMQQHKEFSLIIAPHEISGEHLDFIDESFANVDISVTKLSEWENFAASGSRVLLIDSIGLLANLYALGAIAYVGGGFGVGVHSVLEPAAHGAVVCYGPNYKNSPEAQEMATQKIAASIANQVEFQRLLLQLFDDPESTRHRGEETKNYVLRNVGASRRAVNVLEKFVTHSYT
ncbi:hypothetical protein EH223_03975 [candidate division KSB1 bacterium]|nr:hypothetical protein [candidate division KSB1 bacterium]RQW05754.1 MAG: hypothetical protein EH223_03975 [candidate division KSB1 bacterium]